MAEFWSEGRSPSTTNFKGCFAPREVWGNLSMFNNSTRIAPNGSPKQEKKTGVFIPHPLPDSHVSRSKSNSFSGNRVSPAPLQKEDIEHHIGTLPGTPMSGNESGMNTPQLVALPDELAYDTHEWLEIDRPAEHNYVEHVRTIYRHVLDDLYRRFVPPTDIHEKYLEEIRSPSWETFEKKHKK